uniref:Uncharacterized protein n=1 Tax=Cyanistes caeruleus TaxID=156563 RepID=A0A8C0U6B5_CYACU
MWGGASGEVGVVRSVGIGLRAADEVDVDGTVEDDLGKSREGSRTDDEVVQSRSEQNDEANYQFSI